jgi:hypothetical protein
MKDPRGRRLVGLVERLVLGTAMSAALLVAEQLLSRMQARKN